MKKYFNLSSSVTLERYELFQLTGPFELIQLQENQVKIQHGDYMIHLQAQDLVIETLSEEQLILSFTKLSSYNATNSKGLSNEA